METQKKMDTFQDGNDDSDREDYLQDPEMWGARLPQPYRMVDHILNELLHEAWNHIEHGEICRQQEAAKVKIPGGTSGRVVCGDTLTESYGGLCSGTDVLFIGNGKSVCVMGRGTSDDDELGLGKIIAQCELEHNVNRLAVVQRNEVYIVLTQHFTGMYKYKQFSNFQHLLCLNAEIKILVFVQNNFIEVGEIPHQVCAWNIYNYVTSHDLWFLLQNKDKIMNTTLSSSGSHVAVTSYCSQPSTSMETKLGVYMLPVEAWLSELPHNTENGGSQVSVASQNKVSLFPRSFC